MTKIMIFLFKSYDNLVHHCIDNYVIKIILFDNNKLLGGVMLFFHVILNMPTGLKLNKKMQIISFLMK